MPKAKEKTKKKVSPVITIRQKKVFKSVIENHGNRISLSKAMREAGYTDATAKNPSNLTNTAGWQELMNTFIPKGNLAEKHQKLLNSMRLDHMTFPPLSKTKKKSKNKNTLKEDREQLTDKDIIDLLAETGCQVRRIVHGELARHVYFWTPDNLIQDKALDKGYKLHGLYEDTKQGASKTLINVNANKITFNKFSNGTDSK